MVNIMSDFKYIITTGHYCAFNPNHRVEMEDIQNNIIYCKDCDIFFQIKTRIETIEDIKNFVKGKITSLENEYEKFNKSGHLHRLSTCEDQVDVLEEVLHFLTGL